MTDVDQTLWERQDERVLRWVFDLPPTLGRGVIYRFPEREPEMDDELEGLDSRQINESLHRLRSHDLIEGRTSQTTHDTTWARLRITALGLRVLGEWPDLDLVTSAATFYEILRRLAEDAPQAEKEPLVRAAGVLGRTADAIVRGTATDVARSVGEDVAGE